MSVTIGGVELYMGPKSVGGPDDLDLAIREFIGEADHSLAIAVQEIDSRPIAQAILAAKRRGVQVRVILEGDYLTEEKALADPWNSRARTRRTASSRARCSRRRSTSSPT